MPNPISSVLVVGEGSAGLLAALALKTRFPELDVRILASTRKPIIGVGESTTGSFPFFLHTNLELEPVVFIEPFFLPGKLACGSNGGEPKPRTHLILRSTSRSCAGMIACLNDSVSTTAHSAEILRYRAHSSAGKEPSPP